MLPKYHIIFGAIITSIIYAIFTITLFQAIIIFLSSFLIDIDHYLLYVLKKKDLSLKNAYKSFKQRRINWFQLPKQKRREHKQLILIFHGIEFWILIVLLLFIHKIFLFVLIGVAIHMLPDYIELFYLGEPFYIKLSPIYVHIKNKNKKEFD